MKLFFTKYQDLSDEDLMVRLTKGKKKAFDELYSRYAPRLNNYFYRMLYQDTEKADDFTQDIFLKIIEKPFSFDPTRKFSTWIYTVAGNMCKNEYRKNQVRSIMQPLRDEDPADHVDFVADFDKKIFDSELMKAVDELQEHHKECFLLRYQQELSIKEIAQILDCPEGTVKSRIFYCLRKLKKSLHLFNPNQKRKEDYDKKIG